MEYPFTDIFDIPALTRLCEAFTRINGTVTALLDLEGKVHIATGWQDVCTKFHRATPGTAARCTESDTMLAGQLSAGQTYNVYRCRNGLVDVAVPVIVEGEHLGNFFTGQFFFEPPNLADFARQAQQFGFDQSAYLDALGRVPVFGETEVRKTMDFLVELTQLMGEMGLERLRTLRTEAAARKALENRVAERTLQLQEAKEAAERANRAKSDFLANMSHEIRTPLNAVLGMAYLLDRAEMPVEQKSLVGKLNLAGKSLLGLVNDILDLSKIEAGELHTEQAPFSLGALIDELAALMATPAQAGGLALDVTPPPADVPDLLVGDALRLRQVLLNLLNNAIKFTERGRVGLRVVRLAGDAANVRLRFEVEDSGIGIAPDAQPHLFAPFTQADTSTTRRFGGTGLGLAIVRQLVDLMGGSVEFDSREGEGSRFRVTLDFAVAAEPAGQTAPASVERARLAGLYVLLVDDSEMNLDVAGRILEREGARVETCLNGEQALAWLRQTARLPDAVLMDVQMPVMDGNTAVRAMRAAPELRHLPVIALTAGALSSEKQKSLDAGMDDYLTKPFDPQQMVQAVRRLVECARGAAPAAAPVDPAAEPAPTWPMLTGIDADAARRFLGGDVRLLRNGLRRLLGESGAWRDTPAEPGNEAQRLALAADMHRLAGGAGPLGAARIHAAARALERCLRDPAGAAPAPLFAELAAAFVELNDAAGPWLAAGDTAPAVTPQPAEPGEPAELGRLLAARDLAAVDAFRRLEPALRAGLPTGAFDRLEEAVQRLDFERALAIVETEGAACRD